MHIAVKHNTYSSVVALLQAGANKYSKNQYGQTPLSFAQDNKMKKIFKHFGKLKVSKK